MMYRTAIVDDNPNYREHVKQVLRSVSIENGKEIICEEFSSGKALAYETEEGNFFDIYILDVEMPEMDGMELAKKIREYKQDVRIIFVTSYSRYAIESYEIDAYQYILKEKLQERLPRVLKKIFMETEDEENITYYTISTESRLERFRCRDIIWIYKEGKNAVFVTEKRMYRERTVLSEVKKCLPQEEFIFVERGIIVNLRHVYGVKRNEIELSNSEIIRASRAYSKKVREDIIRYWGQRM